MSVVPSLFDAPTASPVTAAAEWVTGTLLGGVAVSLCVIAIAFVGLRMLTGHLAARDGLRVVVACFVLLGASAIAAGLRDASEQIAPGGTAIEPVQTQPLADPTLPPNWDYDPYAGPSLRRY